MWRVYCWCGCTSNRNRVTMTHTYYVLRKHACMHAAEPTRLTFQAFHAHPRQMRQERCCKQAQLPVLHIMQATTSTACHAVHSAGHHCNQQLPSRTCRTATAHTNTRHNAATCMAHAAATPLQRSNALELHTQPSSTQCNRSPTHSRCNHLMKGLAGVTTITRGCRPHTRRAL